jgi:glycosyltransferase involved in cell wall biosynthesis
MSLALCMVVKDQINCIAGCLEPILDLLDEVVIIDTGSSDGTPELLKHRFGISVLPGRQEASRCYCLSDLRNQAFSRTTTSWILALDADERVSPEAVMRFLSMPHEAEVAGYFGRWTNYLEGETPFEDYKLFLFRHGFQTRGLLHDNVQIDIRERDMRARWLDVLQVDHFPEAARLQDKTRLYHGRLESALLMEPDWHRYHWFLGYMNFQQGDYESAIRHLNVAATSTSPLFPVERLNSCMVLAEIHARCGDQEALGALLADAQRYFAQVADDFEVAINFRLPGWLEQSAKAFATDDLDAIRAYRFAR